MIWLMLDLQIKILDFINAVFKSPGKTIFELYQKKDELQYIKGFRVYKKSIIEGTCKIAA